MINQRCLIIIALLALVLVVAGCKTNEVLSEVGRVGLAQLAPTLIAMLQDKDLVEQLGREVKRSYPQTEPAYQTVEGLYGEAKAAQEGYLGAIRAAAQLEEPPHELQALVDTAQTKTTAFVQAAAAALDPSRSTAGLSRIGSAKLLTLPATLDMRSIKKDARLSAVTQFERQVEWRSWGAL